MGILGGGVVGIGVLGIAPPHYLEQMLQRFVGLTDLGGGIFKAAVFGVIVAVAGCLRGMPCGRRRRGRRQRRHLGRGHRRSSAS